MGHDIYALRPGVEKSDLFTAGPQDDDIDDWQEDDIDDWLERVSVAYVRRSAADPLNQVLYLALGVMDEAYGGASGSGVGIEITLEQFREAERLLEAKSFEGMKRDRNAVDAVADLVDRIGLKLHTPMCDYDASREKEFVIDCIEFLGGEGLPSLTVYFG